MGKPISVEEMNKFDRLINNHLSGKGLAADRTNIDDDYREHGIVIYEFGKYGYNVDESAQGEDCSILYEVVDELQDQLPEGWTLEAEDSDKYNQITLKSS